MPPQENTNTQAPVTPPVVSQTPPVTPASSTPRSTFSMDSMTKNKKFMDTIKTFVIYGAIVSVANCAVGIVISMLHFSGSYETVNVAVLVMSLITGAILGAICGALFFFFFGPVHNWIKNNSFLSSYIHDIFSLFWKPFLVGIVISAAFSLLSILGLGASIATLSGGYAVVSIGSLFIGWIIAFAANIAIYYLYAKTISSKLSSHYPW